jgi:flagellar biosynthesis protein FlhA
MATGCGLMAFFLRKAHVSRTARQVAEQRSKERSRPERIESHLDVDALELQIGLGLVRIVDKARGGDLLERITSLRKQIAVQLGLVVPPIRIRDNGTLEPNTYAVLLRGQEVARGELYTDQMLAIDSGLATKPLNGLETTEPAFGLKAWWIAAGERDRAERLNYTVVAPTGVLATHLTEIINQYAPDLLTRAETNKLLDNLKQRNATLVEEVIPNLLKVGEVQAVLQGLLRERVPIRDLETILETIGDWATRTKDIEILSEYARNALARTICAQYKDEAGVIHCVTFDPVTEDYIQGNIQRLEHGSSLTIPPDRQSELAQKTRQQIEQVVGVANVVVLCSPQVRSWIRRLIEPVLPQTGVLALNEIVRGIEVQAHGVVSLDATSANIPSLVHA